ncbi:b2c59eec-2b0c-4d1f-a050-d97e87ddf845 [Sclerotinia trifoliorum]|uniref:B2c59eec-2b0c-4d1f-a050-d97e87ddf845 n=1 Tax=Sclerotinia trifoliorum TaxID=28548 RepID=A0A8H2W5F7_9HELO|nr:b2c59eec-2b0c-4d1f-a050-d97e87ddf845 [Sclerotinia trifoliorum]
MGINGLLPLLKSIQKPCNLKKFDGKTLGVDAYGWLHRGTVSCAMDLAMGKPTRKYVEYCMHRVRMLLHFGVTPYLIFDGDYLPSKAATEKDREKRRKDCKRMGQELLNAGKTSQAYLEFQKAVDVTPEMARHVIDELKDMGVQYIVAPYEADAQMVYLERQGIIDGILSEDSDLLVFGAKCLLTKLDQYGNCIEVNKGDFCACKDVNLTGWSDAEFRRMAILSGCDYLASMSNMGLKTAYRLVRKHKTIEKVVRMIQFDGKFHVPKNYLESFYQAEFTFLHQRVFCPRTLKLVLHTQPGIPLTEDQTQFIGHDVSPEIARGVAKGDLDPITKQPIVTERRNKMANPFTASKRSVSTNDLKKGVSIDTYFRAKRTPLAELDINCFQASHSQQEILSRNSGAWIAEPVRPYLQRSTTEIEPQLPPHPTPQTSRSTGRRVNSLTESRPPKRARLCEDDSVLQTPVTGQKVELGRSRFFADGFEDDSPSISKISKRKNKQKEDITIFSDDSIEEAMMSIPDIDNYLTARKPKIKIFREASSKSTHDSQESTSTFSQHDQTEDSQITVPDLESSITSRNSSEQPPSPILESSTPLPDLKSRFSLDASTFSTPKTTTLSQGLPTPLSTSTQFQSRIPVSAKLNTTATKKSVTTSAKSVLTPLQRLGAAAHNRFKLPPTPPMTPMLAAGPIAFLRTTSVSFPEATKEKKSRLADVQPTSVPLPPIDDTEVAALTQEGSEDLIIPDSDGEEEPLSPVEEKSNKGLRLGLNLGRFVYAG